MNTDESDILCSRKGWTFGHYGGCGSPEYPLIRAPVIDQLRALFRQPDIVAGT